MGQAASARRRPGGGAVRGAPHPAPPAGPGLVDRPRLSARLSEAVQRPLTVVSAAPGAGKTVALRAWAAAAPAGEVAWVTLDGGTGLDAVQSQVLAALPVVERAAARDAGPPERLAATLARRRRRLVVVLDDAHAVPAPVLAEIVAALLAQPCVRVVLGTRADPDLRLHRLRLEGRLAELRGAELACTPDETAQLLAAHGVELPRRERDLLQARTEGWVAGLRLALLLLAGHPRPAEAVRGFAGDDRAVVAFLVAEVLDRQPPAVREMLVRTAVLDRVSGPLADALTGRHDGAEVLEDLVRRNAFVEPLDRRGRWYRYHPLFGGLLRAQLRRRGPELVADVHRRAARALAAGADPAAALGHAAAGGDWDLVDALLRDHGCALRAAGGGALLDDALVRVPAGALRRRPFAATSAAARELDHGRGGRARALLALADEAGASLPGHRRRRLAAETALVRALAALQEGDVAEVRRHAGRALHGAGEEVPAVRAAALATLGEALVAGGGPAPDGELRAAAEAARRAGLAVLARRADALRAWSYALDGHVRQAALAAGRLLDGGDAVDAEAHLAWAVAALERGDLDAADGALRRGAAAIASGPAASRLQPLALALVRARRGPLAAAPERQALLSELERAAAGWEPPPRLGRRALAARAGLLTALGRPEEAATLLAGAAPGDHAGLALARAGVELALGHGAQAHDRAAAIAARGDVPRPLLVAALGTAAAAAEAEGDRPTALRALERALDVAEQDGLRLPLLERSAELEPLLHHLLRGGTAHRALAGDVLDLARRRGDAPADAPVAPLREPLSDRELAVLRFLPTVLTSQEIAGELFVSLNTVKTHLRSIYRKLDVTGRRAAVERARRLALLAPPLLDGGR